MADLFLDTSVLVAFFKAEDQRTVQIIEDALKGTSSITVSSITVAEVCAASDMADADLRARRMALLELMDVVPVDRRVAERGGELRRLYNLALPDALIAASAETVQAQFISKDAHFKRILDDQVLAGEIYS